MREIREKVRSIYNNVGDTLPVGVHRLTTTEAVNEFATWRKNIARGIISGHFVEEPKASDDGIPDLHSSIITPKFSSNENRVSFEQYQRFLTFMDEQNRQISRNVPGTAHLRRIPIDSLFCLRNRHHHHLLLLLHRHLHSFNVPIVILITVFPLIFVHSAIAS